MKIAISAKANLLGGRGTSALNQDVWGVIFSYLAPAEGKGQTSGIKYLRNNPSSSDNTQAKEPTSFCAIM